MSSLISILTFAHRFCRLISRLCGDTFFKTIIGDFDNANVEQIRSDMNKFVRNRRVNNINDSAIINVEVDHVLDEN